MQRSIGWFGIPGEHESESTCTHVVRDDGTLLCGTRLRPAMEFQWCRDMGDSLECLRRDYVECRKCLRILRAELERKLSSADGRDRIH